MPFMEPLSKPEGIRVYGSLFRFGLSKTEVPGALAKNNSFLRWGMRQEFWKATLRAILDSLPVSLDLNANPSGFRNMSRKVRAFQIWSETVDRAQKEKVVEELGQIFESSGVVVVATTPVSRLLTCRTFAHVLVMRVVLFVSPRTGSPRSPSKGSLVQTWQTFLRV